MTRTDGVRALSEGQRERLVRAVRDAKAYAARHGPVPSDQRSVTGTMTALRYDVISLAVDTGNYWWRGLTARQIRAGMRLIHRILRRGR